MAQFSFLYLCPPEPFVLNPCLKSSVSYHGVSLKLFFQITNYLLLTKLSDFSSEVIPLDLLAFSSCAMRASKNMVSFLIFLYVLEIIFTLVLNIYSCHQWMWSFLLEWQRICLKTHCSKCTCMYHIHVASKTLYVSILSRK